MWRPAAGSWRIHTSLVSTQMLSHPITTTNQQRLVFQHLGLSTVFVLYTVEGSALLWPPGIFNFLTSNIMLSFMGTRKTWTASVMTLNQPFMSPMCKNNIFYGCDVWGPITTISTGCNGQIPVNSKLNKKNKILWINKGFNKIWAWRWMQQASEIRPDLVCVLKVQSIFWVTC